ncbi:unnamed protein product [Bemisia tabaci]|uniref:Transcription factor Sp9 n=1 Tax=Bemisia tabaci TaxID=7038 RepID=A0A9P0F6A4_BEMTA|nr:unnamed protein product [Bemisia tabaci]
MVELTGLILQDLTPQPLREQNENRFPESCVTLPQEHPGLRGTPLAMLAAQCNKLSSKSPPPLADAVVGKGFHPWKKSPQGGSPTPSSGLPQRSSATSTPASSVYSSRPATSSCTTPASYGSDIYFPGSAQAQDSPHQSPLLGKVDSHAALGSVYGRHPYESWAFNHGSIKPEVNAGWWDVHNAASGWLDVGHAQMANYQPDYSSLSHSLAASNTAHLLSSGQHLLQDTYKSMLPGQGSFGLGHAATSPASVSGVSSPQAPSPRSQRRYTGGPRATAPTARRPSGWARRACTCARRTFTVAISRAAGRSTGRPPT